MADESLLGAQPSLEGIGQRPAFLSIINPAFTFRANLVLQLSSQWKLLPPRFWPETLALLAATEALGHFALAGGAFSLRHWVPSAGNFVRGSPAGG